MTRRKANPPPAEQTVTSRLPRISRPLRNTATFEETVLDIEQSLRVLDGGSEQLDPELQNIGMLIRRARARQNLKQVEVSKIAGITQTTLSDIESGKGADGPTARTLVRVCRALNIKIAFMLESKKFGFVEVFNFGNETSARSTYWGEDECEYKNAYIRENAA